MERYWVFLRGSILFFVVWDRGCCLEYFLVWDGGFFVVLGFL